MALVGDKTLDALLSLHQNTHLSIRKIDRPQDISKKSVILRGVLNIVIIW